MGCMQRNRRIVRELRGIARPKALKPRVVARRLARELRVMSEMLKRAQRKLSTYRFHGDVAYQAPSRGLVLGGTQDEVRAEAIRSLVGAVNMSPKIGD